MSETRTLKDKLKNAQEVTSLASSDRLMVVGSDGSPKRINESSFRKNYFRGPSNVSGMSSGKWVRIMAIETYSCGIVWISNSYNTQAPRCSCFVFVPSSKSTPALMQVIPLNTSSFFQKLRIVHNSSGMFMEVFVKTLNEVNDLILAVSGTLTVPDSFSAGEASDDYTLREFDLTSAVVVGGGG